MPTTTSARQPGADRIPSGLVAIRDRDFGYEQARHLLWRAGFGGTPQQIQALASWGPEKSVNFLIGVEDIDFDGAPLEMFDEAIMRPPTEAERRAYREARNRGDEDAVARFRLEQQRRQRDDRRQVREMQKWWLTRMIESPRPLEEKMVLFWHGHFATSYRKIENSWHMYAQNEMFRANAMGNFGEMLSLIIRDPAMLAYLDNQRSRKGRPNENLARELMELFSLGEGNYSENDIKEGARALTGYTFNDNEFVFEANNHDDGGKRILGVRGNLDGDGFVRAILAQKAASEFMIAKLYRYFVGDLPSEYQDIDPQTRTYLRKLASMFRESNYDLRPVLKWMFLSEHFYHQSLCNQQIKSPVQLVVGAIRSLHTPVRDLSILLDALDLMGQNLLFPPSVKGWDGGRSWINTSTLFVRQNIMNFLLTGKKPVGYDALASEEKYDPTFLLAPLENAAPGAERDPDKVIEYLLRFTIGTSPMHARSTLREFVGSVGGEIRPDVVTGILLLISAMPEYQLT